jgi:Tfp pilus assembly protein PilF
MTSPHENKISPAPQTGRTVSETDHHGGSNGLWSQLLAAFRDLSGAFDPFANDADPNVRALGRLARQRQNPQANDYYAIGDLCATLTAQNGSLSSAYAAKVIAAYTRAGAVSPREANSSRAAAFAFTVWVVEAARAHGDYESLNVGLLVCDRVKQLGIIAPQSTDAERLYTLETQLREQQNRLFEHEQTSTFNEHISAERESKMLCDQGQMLLRHNQAGEALTSFERALQINPNNHAASVWRAMALTDLGRFDQAIASYDQALALEPNAAGVWNSKGALLMELGRVKAALICFEHAVQTSANITTVQALYYLNKGKALFMLKRFQEAYDSLSRSHELDPSPESSAGLAACREQLGVVHTESV